jgi:hypothetical protein
MATLSKKLARSILLDRAPIQPIGIVVLAAIAIAIATVAINQREV